LPQPLPAYTSQMTIDWQGLSRAHAGVPFDGTQVWLAVPNLVGESFGGDGTSLDPDFPYSCYLACWDAAEGRWMTSDCEDEDITWLECNEPVFWAVVDRPDPTA
jgi:hypothetical protein